YGNSHESPKLIINEDPSWPGGNSRPPNERYVNAESDVHPLRDANSGSATWLHEKRPLAPVKWCVRYACDALCTEQNLTERVDSRRHVEAYPWTSRKRVRIDRVGLSGVGKAGRIRNVITMIVAVDFTHDEKPMRHRQRRRCRPA